MSRRARFRVFKGSRTAVVLWVVLYVVVAVAPLPVGLISLDPGRGFWINLSVALGFVGLSLFGLQFVTAARSFSVANPIGMDIVLGFHRQMAYVATLFVFAHPIMLFLVDSRFLGLLDIFTSPLRAKFAVASCVALLVLIVLSVYRRRLGLSYPAWHLSHAVLALVVVITALAHVLLVGYYVREPWEQVLWIVFTIAFVALGVWVRLLKPLLRRRRRWVVESVHHDTDETVTITLAVVDARALGRGGFQFEPGQFAWLQARRSAFALTSHPFSIASSAERPHRLRFTIRAHSGFSKEVQSLRVGETMYIDGPFGGFVLPDAPSLVFIAAGVGVTPVLSMLESMADRGDDRRCELWLANRSENGIVCRDDIEALNGRLDLRTSHVLSRPSDDWDGPRGHIDRDFMAERLAGGHGATVFCICGPDGFMNAVEADLRALGVPADSIHSERFAMV